MLKVALGGALLVTATHGLALSLGGLQGSAIIGRPLDVLVQGSIDAAEASSGLCLEADVIYGDVRLPASAITTAIQRLGAEGKGAVRVRANTPVNEPIVTVALRAGCPTSFTRSYTVLADFEAAASAPVRESTFASPATVAQPKASRAVEPVVTRKTPAVKREGEARTAATQKRAKEVDEKKVPTPVRLHAPRPRPAGVIRLTSKLKPVVVQAKPEEEKRVDAGAVVPADQKAATAAPAGPRLKLDPIDTAPGVVGGAGPASAAADKPEATAADTTTAVQPAPEAVKTTDDAVLQKELQILREEQQRMRLAMETMNRQLSEAQQSRYNNPMVYGLGGLALLLAGGAAWLVRKRQQKPFVADASSDPWWTVSDLEADKRAESVLGSAAEEANGEFVSSSNTGHANVDSEVPGLQVSEATESVFLETPVSKIEVSSLVDLWQHVAFFESLGQHAEAANALESFVLQYPRGSEAPYLFWLKLAEQQDDDKAYARAQGLYEQHFHRLVPASAGRTTESLEDDASFMLQLASTWKEGKALGLIERALVSQPGEPGAALQVRTAQSFDDLLVLHGVLETLSTLGLESAQPASNQEWLSVSQIAAVAASQPPSVSSVDAGSMLDFQLPDIESAAQPTHESAPVEPNKELPALDFEFQDFKTPAKPE